VCEQTEDEIFLNHMTRDATMLSGVNT